MNENISSMTQTLRKKAGMPNDHAMGLPGHYYTCPDYFEFETKTVLRNGWHCLGRADEIPNPGDYITLQLLNEPLLIVRGDDGAIRTFSNVCRHRGMRVADGQGNRKLFVCPYHAWSYDRGGALVRAAHMENPNFDPKKCHLPEFACETWLGFLYVNLSDDPQPLSQRLDGLADMLAPYETEKFRFLHAFDEEWACNWKCLVENFMEGYHLFAVHPETLQWYTPTELCTKGPAGDLFTSYHANYPQDIESRGTGAVGLKDNERHRSSLFSVFPAQVASQSATIIVSLNIQPLAADRIRVRWTMSTYGDEVDQETVDQRVQLWNEINREDREKLEVLQKTLGSTKAFAGPLAKDDLEGTIHDFHKFLAREVG